MKTRILEVAAVSTTNFTPKIHVHESLNLTIQTMHSSPLVPCRKCFLHDGDKLEIVVDSSTEQMVRRSRHEV